MHAASQTEHKVNGILKYIRLYLDLRFGHASRLNSKFRQVESDLKWHEIDALRHILSRQKPFGEHRIPVVDLMMSFDQERRRGVFAVKGQLSIMTEIITAASETDQSKASGASSIRDLASLYNAIDPFFKSIFDLMQAWVWWDLPDANDMALLDTQFEHIRLLTRSQLSDNLMAYYRNEMRGDKAELNMQGIREFELHRTEALIESLERRRAGEENYQQIIAREAVGDHRAETLVIQLAQHLRALERVRGAEEVEDALLEYYAKTLDRSPDDVTVDGVVEFEEKLVGKLRVDLLDALQQGDEAGAPYNFKLRQLADIKKRVEALRAEISPHSNKEEALALD